MYCHPYHMRVREWRLGSTLTVKRSCACRYVIGMTQPSRGGQGMEVPDFSSTIRTEPGGTGTRTSFALPYVMRVTGCVKSPAGRLNVNSISRVKAGLCSTGIHV